MKKMMIALAGIAAVMMLVSCQKEVEIDGDISLEQSTTYDYRLKVNGTVTKTVYKLRETEKYYSPDGNSHTTAWYAVEGERENYTVNNWQGSIRWENDPDYKSNVKEYYLTITDDRKEFPTELIIEFYDKKISRSWKGLLFLLQ